MSPRASIIPLFIPHLGCGHDCVFCNQKRISGAMTPVGPEEAVSAIEKALERISGAPQVAFYGGSFTAIPMKEQTALLDSVAPYIADGRVSSIRLSTRPDAINEEILGNLKSHGVTAIELGSQSMCDRVLTASGRGHTASDTVRAAELIKRRGFELVLQMMTGLPGASAEDDVKSAKAIAGLKPDGVRIYPTVIIRGTQLFELWKRGEYAEHSVEDAVSVCAKILPVFESAGIPVIRLGLNPTDELSGGEAVGGAYHPALGELVKSRILLEKAVKLLSGVPGGSDVVLGVNPSCVSQMTGQKRCNILALQKELEFRSVKIRPAETAPGEIEIISVTNGAI